MGDCYFLKNFYQNRGDLISKENPQTEILSSEELSCYFGEEFGYDAGPNVKRNAYLFNRLINGTIGIWFYESDLWDRERLKQKLREIIDRIDELPETGPL